MSETTELIASALREIADQAAPPGRLADAAWRAGRRRRLMTRMAASAASAAAVIAIAVSLTLTLGGGPRPPASPVALGPGTLSQPIQIRQVAEVTLGRCPAHSSGLPYDQNHACVQLAKAGMTVTKVTSARVGPVANAVGPYMTAVGRYSVSVRLTPAEGARFAALTRAVAGQPFPHNELAVLLGGHVISTPVVEGPITVGRAQIGGLATRAQAESIVRSLSR